MSNEVVAVVDDGIIVERTVVDVVVADVELCQVAQVGRGDIGNVDQVGTHLAQKVGAVGNGLQLVENTNYREDGIDGTIQMVLVRVDDLF